MFFRKGWILGRHTCKGTPTPLPYEDKYNRYKDDLRAYEYWQNLSRIEFWDSLDGHAFEQAVARLYRKLGYQADVSKAGGDGGIDIILTRKNESIAVQCKVHKKPVGPRVARDLYGTMIGNGFKHGMLISKTGFTKGVFEFVKDKNIALLDLNELIVFLIISKLFLSIFFKIFFCKH